MSLPSHPSSRRRASAIVLRPVGFLIMWTALAGCSQWLTSDGLTGGAADAGQDAVADVDLDAGSDTSPDVDDGASPDVALDAPDAGDGDAVVDAKPCTSTDVDCDSVAINGCETDILTSTLHCGRCGHDCFGGDCVDGACQPVVLANGQDEPYGIAVDRQEGRVYWTNAGSGEVASISRDGGSIEVIAEQQPGPRGVRAGQGVVFWLNVGTAAGEGQVMRLDTSAANATPETLVEGLTNPTALCLTMGKVFWTNVVSQTGSIMSAPMSGGLSEVIAANLNMPGGISGDDGVYWTVVLTGSVMGLDVLQNPPAVVTLADGLEQPAGVAADTLNVYWTTIGGRIQKRSKLPQQPVVDLAEAQDMPSGLVVDGAHVYWTNYNGGEVMRLAKTGGSPEPVAIAQPSPFDLVDDDTSLYWVNRGGSVMRLAK